MSNRLSINFRNSNSQEILNKYNINIPDDFVFDKTNIIIGTNGCGKTRFLKAIRDIYRSKHKNKVVYGYFPNLSSSKKSVKKSKELPPYTLYEALQNSELEFDDFLEEIERQNEDFIPQLLTHYSQLQKERGEKVLSSFFDVFSELSEKSITIQDSTILVTDKQKRTLKLKDAIIDFSPGELMIFYIALFISLQKNSNRKSVIILDEPECHLHPKALLKFIQFLRSSDYFSSIWIATHSLFLIPEFDFKELIYIDNSNIVPRKSTIYKDIITDLLGNDFDRTTQFIASLSQWEYCQYIAECFINPDVIDIVNPEDEQVKLFISFLKNHKAIKVLDFGGGSARLGLSLLESSDNSAKSISYEIYDPSPKYKGKKFKVHRQSTEISEKYDCVVMMNVLHEIHPSQWEDVFKTIYRLLNNNGYLLFIETAILTKGEMPNATGFLVLDIEELKILFGSTFPLLKIVLKTRQKSICVPIPKKALSGINSYTISKAIYHLEKRTYENLKAERNMANFQTSRYYAFLSQQYLNAKIFNESNSTYSIKTINTNLSNKSISNNTVGVAHLIELILKKISTFKLLNYLSGALDEVVLTKNNMLLYQILKKALLDKNYSSISSPATMDICWKNILILEKEHEPKNTIALFLLCLYVLGDKRSANRINNNGYLIYIEHLLASFI